MDFTKILKTRKDIRAKLKQRRKQLAQEEWREKSQKVLENLKLYGDFARANAIHCYISSEKNREVDTWSILQWLIESEKKVFVPIVKGKEMYSARVEAGTKMVTGQFGLHEPLAPTLQNDVRFSVVIVPLLAIDEKGNRLGYGKGFYDRFLQRLEQKNIQPLKIGIAFDFQVLDAVPTLQLNNHADVPLDAVITEVRRINFNAKFSEMSRS